MAEEADPAKMEAAQPVRRRVAAAVPATGVNGAFFLAEEVLDKLKILNYETEFLEPYDIDPFPRTFFAMPSGSQQFANFLDLVKWLMQQSQRDFTTDKYDDPNTSVNKLMLELKKMGFDMDFPASKLRQAHGEAVCRVLTFLCDQALITRGFRWQTPVYPDEDFAEEAVVDDDAEVAAEMIDETAAVEEEEVMYTELVAAERKDDYNEETHGVMEATVDPIAWRTELERVAPRLRVHSTVSGKEWRAHLEQTQAHEKTILSVLPETQSALEKIGNEVGNMLRRVENKEKYLNNQFDSYADQYRTEKERLATAQESYQGTSQKVTSLTQELSSITDMLEEVKSHMDDRGASMTDTSPLIKIKQGLTKLKAEIKTMDLRIGVVGHTLMQSKIKHKVSGGGQARPEDDIDNDYADDDSEF